MEVEREQERRLRHLLLVLQRPLTPRSLPSTSASEPSPPSFGAGPVSSGRCWNRFQLRPSPSKSEMHTQTHNDQNIITEFDLILPAFLQRIARFVAFH